MWVFIPEDHFALSFCAKDRVPDDSAKNWAAFPSTKNIRVPGLVTNRKEKKKKLKKKWYNIPF